METDPDKSAEPSAQLRQLSLRLMIKTIFKSVIWFGTAWIATKIWPGVVWPWYLAWIFVAIAVGTALVLLRVARLTQDSDSRFD
nr:putative integron gene cassette protein [uncultured bacterium]